VRRTTWTLISSACSAIASVLTVGMMIEPCRFRSRLNLEDRRKRPTARMFCVLGAGAQPGGGTLFPAHRNQLVRL
jgi:hypothetical protein